MRRAMRRPAPGAVVATRYGPAVVLQVLERGRVLVVGTERHGRETLERAPRGWWTVYGPSSPEWRASVGVQLAAVRREWDR